MQQLVIIPTYNEVESIEILLTRILKHIRNVDLLVVDGGSSDGTSEAVARIEKLQPRVNLISEGAKRGLGKAYLVGFSWGLERDYQRIIEMDAGLSHRVRDLFKLLEVN